MNTLRSWISQVSVLSVLIMACSCGQPSTGEMAPELEATLIDGTPFRLSDFKGNYVVLDFWGSWCGPCIRELPDLVKLHSQFGEQVVFVTVAFEKNDRSWKAAAERAGFSWKHQIVEEVRVLIASPIARAFGVTEIPARFLVTPDGKLISGLDLKQMEALLQAELGMGVQ